LFFSVGEIKMAENLYESETLVITRYTGPVTDPERPQSRIRFQINGRESADDIWRSIRLTSDSLAELRFQLMDIECP